LLQLCYRVRGYGVCEHYNLLFSARCTIVQSAFLRLHVVCLSNVGGSGSYGWKYRKLIAQTAQNLCSSQPKGHPRIPRGTWGNFGETRGGCRKVVCWSTKAAISLNRVKIEEKSMKLLCRAYSNSLTLFRMVIFSTATPRKFLVSLPLLSQERVKLV